MLLGTLSFLLFGALAGAGDSAPPSSMQRWTIYSCSMLSILILPIRHCGTFVNQSRLDTVERKFRNLRLNIDALTDYSRTIYIDLHFHVIYENLTLEGGYITYYVPPTFFLTCVLMTIAVTSKSRTRSMF